MFWIYFFIVIVPSVCFYLYINRDSDAFATAFVWSFFVAALQLILLIVGGYIAISIAVLVTLFGMFLGYGAWYMPRLDELVSIPKGSYARFEYLDFKGKYSRRRVLITSSNNTYIEGICSARQSARTFKRSRIIGDIIIESTGEVISPMANEHPEMHKKGSKP